jgi:hypothetical protein
MRVFIGLDVSLAKTAVCVVDHDGAVQWQGKVPSEPGPLIKRLAEWHDRPGARLRPGRPERSSPPRSPWAQRYAVRNTTCCQLGRPVSRTPSWGNPSKG